MSTTTESSKSEVKKEVKIVKKEVINESNTAKQNGKQNGETEAAMTVKLPTKKSAAKTETKVEISKKTLPDGSIEEVKKTITTTTIDGKTEIRTKTETTIIPKDADEDEEEVVEEEEEEESGEAIVKEVDDKEEEVEVKPITVIKKSDESSTQNISENGQENIIKTEERSESITTSTKKVVIVQDVKEDDEEEKEEEEETKQAEPVTVVIKKPLPEEVVTDETDTQIEEDEVLREVKITEEIETEQPKKEETEEIEQQVESEEEEEQIEEVEKPVPKEESVEDVEEEEEYEEAEEKEVEVKVAKEPEITKLEQKEEDEASEYEEEEEVEPEKEESVTEKPIEETKVIVEETKPAAESVATPVEVEIPIERESEFNEKQEVIVEKQEEIKAEVVTEETLTPKMEKHETPETKLPLREPSVPLEKVEDVEIKPIGAGNFVTKSHTETTEIITGTADKPTGVLTEYNRTENIVTVNRTTKTLDYENSQQTIPTLTYFTPHIEKFPPAPQPSRPYQPVYPTEPTSERRHSLLLERLSTERQIPTTEIYHNTQHNQSVEQQSQWSQEEPRVEILTIENVKPSSITNQQWYQQTKKDDVTYNNVAPVSPVKPSWTQPKPQQSAYQPPSQPTYQAPQKPAYQPPQQPAYQVPHAPQPVYQPPPQPQPVYQTQPQYQPTQPQTQYQSYTENTQNSSSQQNTYSTYTPKPTNWASNSGNLDLPTIVAPSQYSYKDSTDSYQSQRSSYVPPPWEQDSNYVVNNSQNYYQPPPQINSQTPDLNQGWKPTSTPKFTKTTPTAYIPPKPNQSFVRHVTIAEPPKQPGRKTYYSEYERRYISVPESTYIPGDTKPQQSQPQPDPSPAYYYDNNEPAETVEHQWRKELREFTEKAQTQPDNVKPPWEMESKTQTQTQYAKTQETYTATPTWSQTLRPQSWRERSFESEFVSQEWPKTNTLGRGRPLSSYGKEPVPERTRGVSVDRYNPNNYQSPVPAEHPPVQTFTHNPPAPRSTGYHNPNVPAYHSRASAEPREQTVYQQPRQAWKDSRDSPFQSRSFKYLQWITGTED